MPDQPPSSDPLTSFGPNEWLVDELYGQYLADKHSVDKAWWDFFRDYEPGEAALGPGGRPPRPPTNGAAGSAPGARQRPAQAPAPATTPAPRRRRRAQPPPRPAAAGAPSRGPPERPGHPERAEQPERAEPAGERPPPAAAARPTTDALGAGRGPGSPLRGAAARVVTNMEASLEVPTATSVRAVPAKLLIDNRIVINNHLSRSRGGKVSFTHIIGFALVQALASMPEMNAGFDHDETGKPVLVQPGARQPRPGHRPRQARRDPPAPRAVHQGRRADGLRPLLDGIRGDRQEGARRHADRRGLPGTTISLTNPGTIGTVHSVPRLMEGQGAIIGVGALEYPAEWQGASNETLNRNAV